MIEVSIDTATPDVSTDVAEEQPAFADLPLREKHAVFGRAIAFEAMVKGYVSELRSEYGDALYGLYENSGTKSVTHDFGDGMAVTFTLKASEDKFTVADEDAFADHVEEHHESEVEWKREVRPAFQTALFKRLAVEGEGDDQVLIDTETGLEVPGVKFTKGGTVSKTVGPSWKGGNAAKEHAVAEVLAQGFDVALPAITTGGDE